jgi:twinkle protein
MQGSKYPCVSVRNGAGGALKDCKAAYEYLDSFEAIVICFDADEAGTKAAREVAELFGGKSAIVKHTNGHKDACDYLKANDVREFTAAFWAAEKFVPDGIINGASLWDEVNRPVEKSAVMYPWESLNKLTYGIREAELVTITAGSGLGKSQFVREIVWHILKHSEDNIGLLFLEENARKTALSLMSLSANKPLHLPDVESTEEERWEAFTNTMGTNRLFLFDHFGSTSVDNIIARCRYMAKALDTKFLFLDHVSIVVSAQSNGDERKALDEICTKLRMLVQETGITLFMVSHLKRPDGKGHEEGAASSLSQLRGSASIAQLSDMVIGLERNGQADDPVERNTTHVRVLKNRFCGTTGKAGGLLFDQTTGRMTEIREEGL